MPGKYVDSYEFPDGRLEFRWKGMSLPYTVFDKDQRVTHSAITENKHLSAVLEHIKIEQDKAAPKKRRAGKQRTRYEQKDGPRKLRKTKMELLYEAKRSTKADTQANLSDDS